MKRNDVTLIGRELASLTPAELEDLLELIEADTKQIVCVTDDEWREYARGAKSLHPKFGMRLRTEFVPEISFFQWEEHGGEEREWDQYEYTIRAGVVLGPMGDTMHVLAVVKWFLDHNWQLALDAAPTKKGGAN